MNNVDGKYVGLCLLHPASDSKLVEQTLWWKGILCVLITLEFILVSKKYVQCREFRNIDK